MDDDARVDPSDALYQAIRLDDGDVGEIARRTGLKSSNVAKVKSHLFVQEHFLDRYEPIGVPGYWARFDTDPVIAGAWKRLRDGTSGRLERQLLRHEIAEAWFMRKHGPSYREAHEA